MYLHGATGGSSSALRAIVGSVKYLVGDALRKPRAWSGQKTQMAHAASGSGRPDPGLNSCWLVLGSSPAPRQTPAWPYHGEPPDGQAPARHGPATLHRWSNRRLAVAAALNSLPIALGRQDFMTIKVQGGLAPLKKNINAMNTVPPGRILFHGVTGSPYRTWMKRWLTQRRISC